MPITPENKPARVRFDTEMRVAGIGPLLFCAERLRQHYRKPLTDHDAVVMANTLEALDNGYHQVAVALDTQRQLTEKLAHPAHSGARFSGSELVGGVMLGAFIFGCAWLGVTYLA